MNTGSLFFTIINSEADTGNYKFKQERVMISARCIFYIMISIIISAAACAVKNTHDSTVPAGGDYVTVTGTAEETKDGYYVAGYVLGHEEIIKYYHDKKIHNLGNKRLEITGKTKKLKPGCSRFEQCRKGPYTVIYDLKSLKITEQPF